MLRIWQTLLIVVAVAVGVYGSVISLVGGQTNSIPTGEVLSGGGDGFIFVINRGTSNEIIRQFDAKQGNKIRLAGFGITNAGELAPRMKAVENNVRIELPGGQQLWILNKSLADLPADVFQVELDRRGLVETFADEFNTFSWDAENAPGFIQEKGTWRTNYGHGPPNVLGSRMLNGELELYADPALRGTGTQPLGVNPFHIENGVLEITAQPTPESLRPLLWDRPYTSGLITTRASFSQLYGVFEMRARLPRGRGLWPAFWLVPANGTWPPELDVMEVLGHETTMLYTTWHSKGTGEHSTETISTRVPDMAADFHLYALEWNKDEIKWYFDGVEIARKATMADMHQPMHVRANLAVGGVWPKDPDASTHFPAVFAIDWIRVYRREQPNK